MNHLGGCLCGTIRFSFSRYSDAGYCHCTRCRRGHGAALSAWALVPETDFQLDSGAPAQYDSRYFCSGCGSSLFVANDEQMWVNVGVLDEPNQIQPRIHRCAGSVLDWLKLDDMLPFVDGLDLTAPSDRHYIRVAANKDLTREAVLSLRAVTLENQREVLFGSVKGSQRRFVATNTLSIAQAHLAGDAWYKAIYAGETVVGFVMAATLEEDELGLPTAGDPNLWRFMIDERYQGHGFGTRSLRLIVDEMREWADATNIWLGCMPGDGSPYEFYKRFGFIDTGVYDDEGELYMRYPLEPK